MQCMSSILEAIRRIEEYTGGYLKKDYMQKKQRSRAYISPRSE